MIKIIMLLIIVGGIVGAYFLGRDHGRDKMSDEITNAIIKMIGGRDNVPFGFTILTPDGEPADYRGELTRIKLDGEATITAEDIKRFHEGLK